MESKFQEIKNKVQKYSWAILLLIPIIFLLVGSLGSSNKTPEQTAVNPPQSTQQEQATQQEAAKQAAQAAAKAQQDKVDAQKELEHVMSLAKTANLITSYEFSDVSDVVYAGPTWYTQTVQFKKDFIAKIAMLKEKITGYHHFEVRDAYTNEKVAEVTAFSGSLEVYK